MAVVIGFICAVCAFLLNGIHLHSILSAQERLFLCVAFLLFGALIGAIAGATSAIVEAIHQQKQASEGRQP
jgi:hypothetical protein